MKIALTTSGADLNAPMELRFGRAARFLVFDSENKSFVVLENVGMDAPQGAGIRAAEAIVKAGASVLVTGDCGPKALNALRQAKVSVYSCKNASVEKAIELCVARQLEEITAA
jgi:predicted Fe-Mo cluster-binding NifX family protein